MTKTPTSMKTHLRRTAIFAGISLAIGSAPPLLAQDDDAVEQIVVTGSFIRNSAFTGASPVDTVDQETLLSYGSANIGQYIRDLTYTQNVDTVANVLGGAGGGQDSNSAQFNLRGLGVGSTLTLLDGRRNVNAGAISAILPDIATDRIEVVLDGGSALYGSDAVAGVVNIIPVKEYDGLRIRTFYNRDDGGDFEEPKLGVLWGKTMGRLNVVAALEVGRKTPLQREERGKFLQIENSTFIGAPGHYHYDSGAAYLDPSCGTYGNEITDKAQKGSQQSGFPYAGFLCGFHYGQWTDYNREANDYVFYGNAQFEVNDKLTIEFQVADSYRESIFTTEPVTPMNSTWYDEAAVPANHPANPTGQQLTPGAYGVGVYTIWNGFEQGVGSSPSQVIDTAYFPERYQYTTEVYKLGAMFDVGDTGWTGEAWLGYQTYQGRVDTYDGNIVRYEAAINGMGGPNGDEYFNPFSSRDIRSPYYDADRSDGMYTNNSQEVVDWLFESGDHDFTTDKLVIFDSIVTGDLFEVPAGTVGAAFGFAMRDRMDVSDDSPLQKAGIDWQNAAGGTAPLGLRSRDDSETRAVFAEFEVPLLENLSMQVAARYEDFKDLGLDTTTPKVAFRYQPIDSLSLRASWGESFLAPGADQLGALNRTACGANRTGQDLLTGNDLLGVLSCFSKNPNLQAENSEIMNVGFTWEGIENLSISIDYQEIEYTDRIVTLGAQDVTNQQYYNALAATGSTPATYDPTPGSASRVAALAWVAANPSGVILRDAATSVVQEVVRVADNINTNLVDVVDLTATYSWDMNDWGSFNAAFNAAYYVTYEYAGLDGVSIDARGRRNADTALSPPLPELVATLRLGWTRNNHAASFITKYMDEVTMDGTTGSYYPVPDLIPESYIANASYTYFFDDIFDTAGSVTLGVNNVFDWEPQRLPVQGGFESRLYDNFGRMVSLAIDFEL
ncbi:MAG: TonB-dependent receptor [Gammaproteobacteria bacterium]|jgi:iron complex outermembrane recepter protein|nr:TonB-dependent receptor [Gammaproteobacteria bacterium]MBT3858259.1 TonB-dependent receptor [Gammaproteobacteria bacterium]MBT3988618.1 TonB-dependent receptor [Gammaproteobacteria bacterium]MBT4580444.1 TonB-dependent receptor [Gammaproteobacteria bacterium]MBT4657822.1 TonB-dependent receptor [Gammaproteobacteria bacterium]